MKLLTVTVPCYNSQDYMEKCIDSLLTGGDRVEIIIVNDGSRDATGQIADRYARQYPHIVRVIHQENGGHGEGINQGVAHATGLYFKVVDSDDCVSEDFPAFVDILQQCARENVDLVLTNYRYVYTDGAADRTIAYGNVLRPGQVTAWSQTRKFRLHQLITLHSGTFRTALMRSWAQPLPKHISYEDNLMVYQTLPHAKTLYYADMDLYRYSIGREGQSVAREAVKKRYANQLLVAQRCFTSCELDGVENQKLKKYMRHELFMMFAIGICFARTNRDDKSDSDIAAMWEDCREFDPKWEKHFRSRSALALLCLPGKLGRAVTNGIYGFANRVIRYY